jgi:protein-S-isoprenylcysteine O-methyltransferase Ste14
VTWGLGYALLVAALVVRFRATDAPPPEPARPLAREPLWLTRVHHALFAAILIGAPLEAVIAGGHSSWRLSVLALFVLLVRIVREEDALARTFPDYARYAATTKRLVPFVY